MLRLLGTLLTGFLLVFLIASKPAQAGHLFTQTSGNGPVSFSNGQSVTVTQNTTETAGTNGQVLMYFADSDFNAGDSFKLTIGSYSETFTYNNIAAELTGGSITASSDNAVYNGSNISLTTLSGVSATLATANIDMTAVSTWSIESVSGDFTWYGYRISGATGKLNGTGAPGGSLGGSGNFKPSSSVTTTGGVATTLDNLVSTASGEMSTVVTRLNNLSSGEKSTRMKQLIPDTSGAAQQASTAMVQGGVGTVQVRISQSFGKTTAPDIASNLHVQNIGMSSGDNPMNKYFWAKGFFSHGLKDNQEAYAGYESDVFGTSFGFDTKLDNGLLLGAAYSFSKANVDLRAFKAGDGVDIESHFITPYLAFDKGDFDYQLMATFARHSYDSNRNTNTTGIAYGSFYGLQASVHGQVDYNYQVTKGWILRPNLAAEYDRNYTSAYTESGAGVLNLDVASEASNRLRSIVGLDTQYSFEVDGFQITPSTGVSWTREYRRNGGTTTSQFTGGGDAFSSAGQELDSHKFGVFLNLGVELPDDFGSFNMKVTGEESNTYKGYGGELQYTVAF